MSFVVLETLFELKDGDLTDLQLYCGGTQLQLNLESDTFSLNVSNGQVENRLVRFLSTEQARALGQALIKAADDRDKQAAEWERQDRENAPQPADETCFVCSGTGKL